VSERRKETIVKTIIEGVVQCGANAGDFIRVCDDRGGDTGGFYLFIFKEDGGRYDLWFADEVSLKAQMEDYPVL
jgi:hypothetical protein